MSQTLEGRKIAILATDGVGRVELEGPRDALVDAGAAVELLSLHDGDFRGFDHLDQSATFTAQRRVADATAADYDGVLIPAFSGRTIEQFAAAGVRS